MNYRLATANTAEFLSRSRQQIFPHAIMTGADVANEAQKRELEEKLRVLVTTRFGGNYRAAFGHYDVNQDGSISKDELKMLLSDAGVGSGLTRWAWANGIIEELDKSGDGQISWEEFTKVFDGVS